MVIVQQDRLIRIAELKRILGVSRSTIMRDVKRGALPQPIRSESAKPHCRWWLSDIKAAIGAEDRQL